MLFHNSPTSRQQMEVGILVALTLLLFAYRGADWDFVIYSVIILLLISLSL
jgi:hypothetical protein